MTVAELIGVLMMEPKDSVVGIAIVSPDGKSERLYTPSGVARHQMLPLYANAEWPDAQVHIVAREAK